MAIRSACPKCRTTYDAPDEVSGRKVRCVKCQEIFRVEPPPQAAPPAADPAKAEDAPPRRGRPARRSPPRSARKPGSRIGLVMAIFVVLFTLLILGATFTVAGYFIYHTMNPEQEARPRDTTVRPPQFDGGNDDDDDAGPPDAGDGKVADYEAAALAKADPGPTVLRPRLPAPAGEEEAPPARADGSLAQDVLQRVKDAVPLMMVTEDDGSGGSGSGFLVEPGIVVTNRHVVGMLDVGARPPRKIEVVFYSGEANELKLAGEVIGQDPDEDLAIVRVPRHAKLPRPLAVATSQTVSETQPVFVVGFPGGPERSKNVTVTKTSVSSLIKEAGRLKTIQVFGGMNPGNSGGPVVDGRGQVVGVSVAGVMATIARGRMENTGINYAIPGDMVRSLLHGAVSAFTLEVPRRAEEGLLVPFTLEVADPRQKLTTVEVAWWLGKPGPERPPTTSPPLADPADTVAQTVKVALQRGQGRGELRLPTPPAGKVVWLQLLVSEGRDDQAVRRWSAAVPYQPPPPLDPRPLAVKERPSSGDREQVALAARVRLQAHANERGIALTTNVGAQLEETYRGEEEGKAKKARALTALDLGLRERNRPFPQSYLGRLLRNRSAKLPPGFTIDRLARDDRPAAEALAPSLQGLLDALEVPLPQDLAQPWKAKVSLPVFDLISNGPSPLPLDLTFTPQGVRQRDGVDEGIIRIEGKSSDGLGRFKGHAWIDLATGQVFLVRATAEFQIGFHMPDGTATRANGVLEVRLERKAGK
jgi:S1-C subfamily serine protease